jgi:VWFA-related protein
MGRLATTLVLVAVSFGLLFVLPSQAAKKNKELIEKLPEKYQAWLEEVDLLISKEERAAFLELGKDYQRDAFIERFWRLRDPFPDTGRNEFKDRWDARVAEARQLFGRLDEERSVVLLLNGFPDALLDIRCSDLWPLQTWFYQRAENLGHEAALLFYQRGGLGPFRLWYPSDGLAVLMRFGAGQSFSISRDISASCEPTKADALLAAIRFASTQGMLGFSSVVAGLTSRPDGPTGEWVATFNSYTTDLPTEANGFDADLSVSFPGRYKARTVLQGLISVDPSELKVSELGPYESYNLVLIGEVLREDRLFDSFRYSYNHPLASIGQERVPLVFERYLRPGAYTLIVRLEDVNAESFFRTKQEISVPRVDTTFSRPPSDPETARLLEEANAAIARGETSLKIVPPQGDLLTGMLRFDTLTSGSEIAEIVFSIDGRQVLKKRNPPWSVEFDLGSLPRMRTLTAVAFDRTGEELTRDVLVLNAGSHRFAVRLIEPRRGKRYRTSLRAEAQIDVPVDQVVERVEFYLNESLVATLFQPPFVQPIFLPSEEEVAYVRAVAYQPDGNSTEDLVFVNAPEYLEELDVQFVELYIAALNKDLRPVDNLDQGEFAVREDGIEQVPVRFEHVANLPIHAGILIDVSASMIDNLESAQVAALKFFQQAITPKDRASLITFNDHPNLAASFTNDVAQLAGGLAGLKAERGTALYDSVIFSLYYFNGIKGQRALIILSDGQDEHSRFSYEDTLEYARRAGVAIYSIGLNLTKKQGDAPKKLRRLAQETGGRTFLIQDISQLEEVYREIQRELRSRYYLAYQSTNTSESEEFRRIEVLIARAGVEAKTLRGYYP